MNPDARRIEKHGSGVGLINVDKRLRLRFGDAYGLKVKKRTGCRHNSDDSYSSHPFEATEENLARYEGETV